MFCKNCGNEVNDTAAFCPKCGIPIKDNAGNGLDRNNNTNSASKLNKNGIIIAAAAFICIVLVVVFVFVGNKSKNGNKLTSEQYDDNTATIPDSSFMESSESDDNGLTSITLKDYTVTVPSSYSLEKSTESDGFFYDKNNNMIIISLASKSKDLTGQMIKDNANEALDDCYETLLGLDPTMNGGITSCRSCGTGDFEGVLGTYVVADKNLKLIAVMANDSDLLSIAFFGMDNPLEVFELVDVIH